MAEDALEELFMDPFMAYDEITRLIANLVEKRRSGLITQEELVELTRLRRVRISRDYRVREKIKKEKLNRRKSKKQSNKSSKKRQRQKSKTAVSWTEQQQNTN